MRFSKVNKTRLLSYVTKTINAEVTNTHAVSEAITARTNRGFIRILPLMPNFLSAPGTVKITNCQLTLPHLLCCGIIEFQKTAYRWEMWEYIPGSHGSRDDVLFALGELQLATGVDRKFEPFNKQLSDHLAVNLDDFNNFKKEMDSLWNELCNEKLAVIHGDLHGRNLIKNERSLFLIDFNDMGVGPRAWDAASAVSWLRVERKLPYFDKEYFLYELSTATKIPSEEILRTEPLVAWHMAMRVSHISETVPRLVNNASNMVNSLLYPEKFNTLWAKW